MKVAFDFDSTLAEVYIQDMAYKFIEAGHEVFIITSRSNRQGGWDNSNVDKVAKSLGIERIIYTSGQLKLDLMPEDTDLFFDDDMEEVEAVNKHMPNTVAICTRPMSRKIQKNRKFKII